MFVVSVMYPNEAGSTFDHAYYMRKHIPLARARWTAMGLRQIRVPRAAGTPDGSEPPVQVIALLEFGSRQEFEQAVGAHGSEIMGDVPNFTNLHALLQFNETVE
jgi:uncharacterized protein (TIGR02118 family)